MPYCVVKGCNNHSSKSQKQDGITYHRFPSRYQYSDTTDKWIEVIRASRDEPLWLPKSNSVVCSAHFNVEDLYYTQKGRCHVLQTGYPKIFPVIPEQLQRKYLRITPNVNQPAAPTQSDNLGLRQPITCNNDDYQISTTDRPINSDISQQSTINDLNTVQVQSEQVLSNLEILRKDRLRKRVLYLQKKLTLFRKKKKTLNQKIRRLQMRNKSLKKVLDSLQNRNSIDTDGLNRKKVPKKRNALKTM